MTRLTVNERFAVAAVISGAGGGVALTMIGLGQFSTENASFLRVALAGAFLAGLPFAGGFGRQGIRGLLLALFSFSAATVLGALLAVVLLPLDALWTDVEPLDALRGWVASSVIGPFYVLYMMKEEWVVLAVWIAGAVASHFWRALSSTKVHRGHTFRQRAP